LPKEGEKIWQKTTTKTLFSTGNSHPPNFLILKRRLKDKSHVTISVIPKISSKASTLTIGDMFKDDKEANFEN